MDHTERLTRMRRAMEREHLDALALRLPENVVMLSGFWPMIGATHFVFPLNGMPTAIVPACYRNEAEPELWDCNAVYYPFGTIDAPPPADSVRHALADAARNRRWKRIGYEGNFETIAPPWNSGESQVPAAATRDLHRAVFDGVELVDASALLQTERLRKTPYEASRLRTVSEISCIGLEAFEKAVDVGRTGLELAALVEREIMVRGVGHNGALRVRAYAQVATGPEESAYGYRPNEISTTRPLKTGEVALLELGVVADGFWADRTRLRITDTPTDEQQRVFNTVRSAQETAIEAIRPGATGAEVDAAARSLIRDAGYAESFPHITGHGLGFGYHEFAPILAPGSAAALEEGMCTSVEPGIYFIPAGGFRIEDDVLVTATGAEVLGPFPKNL